MSGNYLFGSSSVCCLMFGFFGESKIQTFVFHFPCVEEKDSNFCYLEPFKSGENMELQIVDAVKVLHSLLTHILSTS